MPAVSYQSVVPGAIFGRLTVVYRLRDESKYTRKVLCACSCGNRSSHGIDGLVQGLIKSCGCLKGESTARRNTASAKFSSVSTAPDTKPTFLIWRAVVNRCYNNKQGTFARYGAKGVRMCDWLRSSPHNLISLIGCKPSPKHSIDRFPVFNGNYTCGSCEDCKSHRYGFNLRWATRKEQVLNRSSNVRFSAFGQTLTKSEWMELTGMDWSTITRRLKKGWSPEKCFGTPDRKGRCYSPTSGTPNV